MNSGSNEYPNTYFKLGADIIYTHTTDWDDANSTENNYTPIGTEEKAFCGIFDGQGHTISGIRIKKSSNYVGLFGRVYGATVKNVTLNDASITGYRYAGGIAGQMNGYPTIENCLVLNTAITANSYRGAVVGYRLNGTLNNNHYRNCTVNGNTTGVGCNGSDRDGARSVHSLTLTAGITAMGESVVIDGVTYYASNTTITLTYSGEVPVGYTFDGYFVNGLPIDGNTFTMPAADAAVSAWQVAYFDAADNSDAIDNLNGEMVDVELSGRTLYRDGDWNTLCLPFDVDDLTGTPLEGATLMELGNSGACNTGFDAGTGTLTLDFVSASGIEAGHAYIVKWETTGDPIVNPMFRNVTIDNENPEDQKAVSQDGSVTFVGNYGPVTLPGGDKSVLYLGNSNTLYYPAADRTMGAFRAYFQLDLDASNPVKAFVLNFDEDDPTDIKDLKDSKDLNDDAWYDLSGRKLGSKPSKRGIYIRDGRKVLY